MALGGACKPSSGDSDSRPNKQRDQQNVMTASQVSASRDSLLFPLQFTFADDGLEVRQHHSFPRTVWPSAYAHVLLTL